MNNLTLKQKSIIDYSRMIKEGQAIAKDLSKWEKVVITEENKVEMKTQRAKINKQFNEYKEARKKLKKAVLEPYDEFEEVYSKEFKEPYLKAKKVFDDGIKLIEQNQLEEKTEELKKHFKDLNAHEWLTFDRLELKINLSTSINSLKTEMEIKLSNINEAIKTIELQPNKERILVAYQRSLDLNKSIQEVLEAVAQEEALKSEPEPIIEVVEERPTVEAIKPQATPDEPKFKRELIVTVTLKQFHDLMTYLQERGIEYE